jgi:hypothetical protein
MKGLETIMGKTSDALVPIKPNAALGYAKWIGNYAESDCVLVEILYECGAVPFVRTNVPQTLMVQFVLWVSWACIYGTICSGAKQ